MCRDFEIATSAPVSIAMDIGDSEITREFQSSLCLRLIHQHLALFYYQFLLKPNSRLNQSYTEFVNSNIWSEIIRAVGYIRRTFSFWVKKPQIYIQVAEIIFTWRSRFETDISYNSEELVWNMYCVCPLSIDKFDIRYWFSISWMKTANADLFRLCGLWRLWI
jgi:hypothetical protein